MFVVAGLAHGPRTTSVCCKFRSPVPILKTPKALSSHQDFSAPLLAEYEHT